MLFSLVISWPAVSQAQKQMTVATASLGGAYYPIGNGIAELVNKYVSGVKMTAEVTGGTVENVRLVGDNQTDLGICNSNHAYAGLRGQPPYKKKYEIRALGSLHGSAMHIVTIDKAGVKTIPDLKGKKVAAGPAGGGPAPVLESILSVYEGMSFKDIKPSYVSFTDGISALKDGNVSAALVLAGVPAAAVLELGATEKVRFVDIPKEKMAEILKKYPYFYPVKIPARVYKTDQDHILVGVRNLLIVNAQMEDKMAYEITKAIYAHLSDLAKHHAAVKSVRLDDSATPPGVPLHPGAMRFFKEAGVLK
jgi:TRAP transporter TAXI family solute receptor